MSANHLRPQPNALDDELTISAMVAQLRTLSDFDLSDQRLRTFTYRNSCIPLAIIYRLDTVALKTELIRRGAMRKIPKPNFKGSPE